LYPGRAGERSSWLTLHAFRGEVWDRAVAYLQGSDLPNLDGFVSGFIGGENPGAAWWMGDHEHAVRSAQRELGAVPVVGSAWKVPLTAAMNLRLGQAHHSLGQYARAMDALRKNVELLAGDLLHDLCYMTGLPSVFSRAWLALCLADRGDFGEALVMAEEALRIAEIGDPGFSLVVGCAGLGNVCVTKGDFARAVAVLEPGLPREPGEVIAPVWPFVASALGAAYTHLGRAGEALPLLEEAVERAAALKLKANHSLRVARLAEAHLGLGQAEHAFSLAAQALDLAQEHRERGYEAHVLRLLATIELARETPALDRAEEGYRKALALAESLGMQPLQAHCHRGLGRLYQRQGDPEAGSSEVAVARELFRAMDMTFWLDETE
jgi:tetratricopeptide (TPR) repeat protein